MNKKTIKSIKDTLLHWDRMIKFASKQPCFLFWFPSKRKYVCCDTMYNSIKEEWYGNDCPLCNVYEINCGICPLGKKFGSCSGSYTENRNKWSLVCNSKRWGTWTKRAKEFREQIRSLLEE